MLQSRISVRKSIFKIKNIPESSYDWYLNNQAGLFNNSKENARGYSYDGLFQNWQKIQSLLQLDASKLPAGPGTEFYAQNYSRDILLSIFYELKLLVQVPASKSGIRLNSCKAKKGWKSNLWRTWTLQQK